MSEMNNTDAIASACDQEDLESITMILGDRTRIRNTGIIRPGIKVPKAGCTNDEKQMYAKLFSEGKRFDEIDVALGGKPRSSSSKLRPENVDYLTICEADFRNPAEARMIVDKYADSDGKVRRIPVWFPVNDLTCVVPHSFRGFGGDGSVRCYSEYENGIRICNHITKEEIDDSIKMKRRPQYARRICDSESCTLYKSKKCRFGGLFRVNIPGLRGMGEVIIPTSSWNGLADAIANLKRIRGVRGYFNGLFKGNPFVEICKVLDDVTLPDNTTVKQWIVTIEPSVDLMELARHNEPEQVMARAHRAINSLYGTSQLPAAPVEPIEKEPSEQGKVESSQSSPEDEVPTEQTSTEPVQAATSNQIKMIKKKVENKGIETAFSAYLQELEVANIEQLPANLVNTVLAWIQKQ